MESLFDDCDQDINGHCDPDLCLDGILGGTEKGFDAQVLFDPLEEQLHLPAAAIEVADDQSRQGKIIGKKYQCFVGLNIVVFDAS